MEVLALQADLETWEGAESIMAAAYKEYGRIDVLINNVGGTIWAQPYEHYQPEQIQKEIQRSLFPTLWCCRAVLPYMVEQQKGAIVNVSSVATRGLIDRKSTRLNSSHVRISYAVFCLKKKTTKTITE